jgi:phage FluMu protein gp41
VSEATYEINLVGGYVDDKNVRHSRVVFGRRITAKDLFAIDESPAGRNPTQYSDLVIRAHITAFGDLKMPVPLTVLLGLDSVDRDDLNEGCNAFQALSAEDRNAEFLPEHQAKLFWGFKINDVSYDRVKFGKRITGMDEIEADQAGLKSGIRRVCLLIGKQIESIATADGLSIDGPIPLNYFESLDGADVATLRGAAELWRQSFRLAGTDLSRNGRGPQCAAAGAQDRLERGADSRDAGGAAQ